MLDVALAEALGAQVSGTTEINHISGQPFRISNLDLQGDDYGLKGDAEFNGLGSGLEIALDAILSATDLSRFSGDRVRLRFHLKDGEFYSFWITPDEDGASNGYVGAGGPGFNGVRDSILNP